MSSWILTLVMPVVVPVLSTLVVAGAKKAAEVIGKKVPTNYLPAVAMAVGALVESLAQTQVIPGVPSAVSGAVLGAAGIGVRELLDQLRYKGVTPAI